MKIIGLTGGIGSGKSTVAILFALHGIPVYVADNAGKRLISSSPHLQQQLAELLGIDVFCIENEQNRKLMATLIFNNKSLLTKVNSMIHPEVSADFDRWLTQQEGKYAVLESAILFEAGFNSKVDVCLTVYAPESIRIQRVMARDNVSADTVLQRMHNQLPDEIKKQRAHYVLINDDRHALLPQFDDLLFQLENIK